MTQFIQLTNANPDYKGKPILLDLDRVISIYRDLTGEYTQIFVPGEGSWIVIETVEQIAQAIDAIKPKTTRKRNGSEG